MTTDPQPGQTYQLPSKSIIIVQRKQLNDSFACLYIDSNGVTLKGRSLAPGVTLVGEFLLLRCQRVS